MVTNYSYDNLSRLLSVLHQASGTTTIDGAGYTYDNAGNRTSKTNYLNSTVENYAYDAIYQLQQVTQGANTTENYTYDKVGNRLTSLGVASYNYNSSNQLTSADGTSFTYDHNGNTTSKSETNGQTTYVWDFENRLSSVTLPSDGGVVSFKYDPFGRRIQKSSTSGTATYVYDGANGIEELNGSGAVSARYVQGAGIDEPLAQSGSALSYYDGDGLGSITSLTDATGTPAATFVYGAFGVLSSSSGTTANSYRYTAREYDQETGLYYYRARYYEPIVGRFLNEDEIGIDEGTDLYPYVGNSPATFRDPLGLYKLKGFPEDLKARMKDAIDRAIKKLKECPSCAGPDGALIAHNIERAVFVYVPDLHGSPIKIGSEVIIPAPGLCGNAEPRSKKIIKIGYSAFDTHQCCLLESTISHEAAHKLPTNYDHDQTEQLEKKCFNCPLSK